MYLMLSFVLICAIIFGAFLFLKTYESNLNYFNKDSLKNSMPENKNLARERDEKNIEEYKKQASIIFVGDLMFDRSIRQFAKVKGNDFIFERIHDYLTSADLVVANLEGPITLNPSVSIGTLPNQSGHFKFTFDPGLAETLFNQNIEMVNLGNNHILNFGDEGLAETQEYLSNSKVEYFGDVGEKFHENREVSINSVSFIFVNYNQFVPGSLERTMGDIKKAKDQNKFIVVYTHWGTEYAKTANSEIKKIAHSFVDSGADLVMGTHPHVIQDKEAYNGKMIYYSLGNFIFDQYFSPETMEGLAVKVNCDKEKKCNFEEETIKMKTNGQTQPSEL
jgi:gamma-polyglutamate biosynthesis protein CapA